MENLLKKIEECRHEIMRLSYSHDLTSEIIVQTSEKMDMLLNDYNDEHKKQNEKCFFSLKKHDRDK